MTEGSSPHPIETILSTALRRLLAWGVPLSALALILPAPGADDSLWGYSIAHLLVLQVATLLLVIELGSLMGQPWFSHLKRPWLASSASVVAVAVGFSALLTLGTSAAARYEPSLQFLQLLSSLDIAWVVAALYLGTRLLSTRTVAMLAGSALLLACVASIAVYLSVVGFTAGGGWLVDGGELLRIVLPSDLMAAVISISVLLVASKRADQPTEQARLQS